MQVTNMQELPLNDFLCDDMLLKVMDSNPWYANIINYMVLGHVPSGENRRKLQVESRRHLWDDPYLYHVCSDGLVRRCVPTAEGRKSLKDAMQHHTEAITEYSAQKPKSSNAGSSGRRCMKTPRSSFEGAENANYKVASQLATQCPPLQLTSGDLRCLGH